MKIQSFICILVLCLGLAVLSSCGHSGSSGGGGLSPTPTTCTIDQFLGLWGGGVISSEEGGGGCIDITLEENQGTLSGNAVDQTQNVAPVNNCVQVSSCEYQCDLQNSVPGPGCESYDMDITFTLDPSTPDQLTVASQGTICDNIPFDGSATFNKNESCSSLCTVDQFAGLWCGGEIYADDLGGGYVQITLAQEDGVITGTVEIMEGNRLQTADVHTCTQVTACEYHCVEEIEPGLPDCDSFDVELTFILFPAAPDNMLISAQGMVCSDVPIDDSDTFTRNQNCNW